PPRSYHRSLHDALPIYWARFQRTKGAIKLHLQLDHQGCLPCWALVTDGDTNDVRIAQKLEFAPGTIVVIDRGYLDYALYERWTQDRKSTRLNSSHQIIS